MLDSDNSKNLTSLAISVADDHATDVLLPMYAENIMGRACGKWGSSKAILPNNQKSK